MELPHKAVKALANNRKIEAIKILRKEKGIGLKEAKEQVEAYIAGDPVLKAQMAKNTIRVSSSGCLTFIALICLVVVAYVLLTG